MFRWTLVVLCMILLSTSIGLWAYSMSQPTAVRHFGWVSPGRGQYVAVESVLNVIDFELSLGRGGRYGPRTLQGRPYGGLAHWTRSRAPWFEWKHTQPGPATNRSWRWRLIWLTGELTNSPDGSRIHLAAPFWLLAMTCALYPAYVFLVALPLAYRRRRLGLCANCNYDLTGNVSGRCPECGAPTADAGPRVSPFALNTSSSPK